MRIQIHSQHWHKLSNEEIVRFFDESFDTMTIQPNMNLVFYLRILKSATLEVLENRTSSTVYRIRQTGFVYQICQPNGDTFEYEDYESYLQEEPLDKPIEIFAPKPLKFTAETINGELIITHLEPPHFKAKWIGGFKGFDFIEEPNFNSLDVSKMAKLLRKAGAFVNQYFKDEENK